ncbi:MAG: NADPH:quinone oxidoreductase family protein [Mucilaginibacter sp.]|nr:NADPH:quinone oxidoreductase family protein [Mucilaginibacter sp.]
MKAIQLTGFDGVESLLLTDVPVPVPGPGEVLIQVKSAGINYAEVEQIQGKYLTFGKELPFTMGFEVAGTVAELGPGVEHITVGSKVTSFAISGGFAEYATAPANALIPIPADLTFHQATTIPIQAMTAYTMLKYHVIPYSTKSVLIQAAAGGVGLYLVQLAKIMGVKNVIAMASSDEKLTLVKSLGADVAVNYFDPEWPLAVKQATNDEGPEVLLQMMLDEIAQESFRLTAPNGRIVLFGSKNYHDTISTEQVRQLIWQNQTLAGFAYPSLPQKMVAESLPELLQLIGEGKLKIFADHIYSLEQAKEAFLALQSRKTIGKVAFEI